MDLTMLLISGAVAGILAGLLGIGGGIVIVPIVTLLFESHQIPQEMAIKMALGTSLATIIVTAISSIYAHHRKGAVVWHLFRIMVPGILIGSLLGAWLADLLPGDLLYIAFILFLFAVSVQMALSRVSAHHDLPGTFGLTTVATVVGVVSALMGIGGGSLNVPFLSFCGVPIKRAIATAAAIGLPISVSATFGYIVGGLNESGLPSGSLGYVNLPVFGGVVVASLLFAPLGATLAHKLPDQLLRRLFAIFLFAMACRMCINIF
ncbi:MAG: sulfite exporter TauE/SafE family protein [Candidatus Thiodiazotropha sp.]|nr:sulfite exporter TauE/SafE family protein [Candidatus Thiodiazotropha sp.]MCU7806083.1 sulfite exporter TauE/SafE family protein [Candidatus Thiodiazotropha sp. (ex Lucinoma borealis)]MCM8882203.1 sulfite exporter TauE/SafE family protein [Candidatus Thiodiazotropha sp.]MCM8919588.1 sulfite exporter TauE/SafE family protein [Candidatus Thiodiazotropha sp.]MCU7869076.1 sulfite exporter TauE/SafE family protein [Candidatus Thiodiazotropha sp. (ex Lucinoma borealis)]